MDRNWKFLTLSRQDRVLTVRFDSGGPVNCLSYALMRELTALALELRDDCELSAIILVGREGMFCAGADLKDPEMPAAREQTMLETRQLFQVGPKMCAAWEALEPITIAAIEGWCIGGGIALVSACDWRVAAEDASLYVPELKLGMNMSWQSVPRLINLIGPARTKTLLIIAEPLAAEDAAQWGLVDHLSAPGKALDKAGELALKVAAMPPIAVRMAKQGINNSANALNNATSFMDADQFLLTQGTADAREGLQAFLDKRPAQFKGN